MKVHELITILQKYDPELKVVVDGYEGGYDDIDPKDIEITKISTRPCAEWYDGAYDSVYKEDQPFELAVYIPR